MYRASLKFPADYKEEALALLAEAFSDISSAHVALREGSHTGDWKVEWILSENPNKSDLTARLAVQASIYGLEVPHFTWDISKIDTDTDWLAASYRQFPPFSVGPFFIHGSHYEENIPAGQMALRIDAATAFGSGEHGTTKGCLQAMLDLKGRGQCPWNVLDMGTGSGILAIAAWKLWKTPILAIDNDPECIRVTEHHCDLNGVKIGGSAISTQTGDGFSAPLVAKKAPFDLIIANILAAPLIDMAEDLAEVSDEKGYVILSGMLGEQAQNVLAAYEPLGFTLKDHYDIGEWSTLCLHRA